MEKFLKTCACLSVLLCCALPAHAEWVRRITDGIMGTRITVEVWAEDRGQGGQGNRCACSRKCGTSTIR